jgi:hypothetical protein
MNVPLSFKDMANWEGLVIFWEIVLFDTPTIFGPLEYWLH